MTVIATGVALAALAAGCGHGSRSEQAAPGPLSTQASSHACPGARRQWRTAWRDLASLRTAVRDNNRPGVVRGTTVFLNHLDASKAIPLKAKNRLIDHAAAAATAGGCDQCFQQLEADRPILSIRYHITFTC